MKLFTMAWRNIWRHARRSLITAVAMSLGVALTMAYLSLAEGMFGLMFDLMVSAQLGHVQMHHPDYPKRRGMHDNLAGATELEKTLRHTDGVTAVAGRVFGHALVAVGEEASGGQLTGINPVDEQAIRELGDKVVTGEYLGAAPAHQVLVGIKLAEELKAKIGDDLVVVTQAADGSMGNELYRIVGILQTGALAIDKSGVFLHRDDLRELLALGDVVHELALLSAGKDSVPAMRAAVERAVAGRDDVLVRSWDEVNLIAAQYMQMQDAMYIMVALVILGLAGLGILNTMLMSVFERTRELGVLIALGLRPKQVRRLILLETFLLTLLALGFGVVIGGLGTWYIVDVGIPFGNGFDMLGIHFPAFMKGAVSARAILSTVSSLFVISIAASLWPAVRASRLQPVVAMREV